MIILKTTPEEAQLCLLELLRQRIPAAPDSYLRQLLRSGKVRCEGAAARADTVPGAGRQIRLPDSRRLLELMGRPCLPEAQILYEDHDLLALFKPAGLAVHCGVGHEEHNLVHQAQGLIKARGERFKVAPAHRLDLPTSGPVLFGKGRRAIGALGKQFMGGQVEKRYLALVQGEPCSEGELHGPIPAKGKLKEARSSYRRLATGKGYSLVEVQLDSGRTHQIRRQFAELGHPLVGDRRYGGRESLPLGRIFLHCRLLALPHPFNAERLRIASPLPPDLQQALERLGIPLPSFL